MFDHYLKKKKQRILDALTAYVRNQKTKTIPDNKWGSDVLERLSLYMQNGKTIRGTLVYLGYDLTGQEKHTDGDTVALAAELFHAGLLIHDDIMDHDDTRRGKPSMHVQYTNLLKQDQVRSPENTGASLGICVGDAAFFYGYQLLSKSPELTAVFSQELANVTIAQMQDVYMGASIQSANLKEILSMYRYKSGRYSITLPLTAGAMLGNAKPDTITHLQKFGADIGVAFQLVDDTLDLFGDPKVTGKPADSDIREGKQTPYMFFLREKADAKTKTRIEEILKKDVVNDTDTVYIKEQMKTYHINTEVNNLIARYTQSAEEALQKIPMAESTQQLFTSFVDYLTNRIQ